MLAEFLIPHVGQGGDVLQGGGHEDVGLERVGDDDGVVLLGKVKYLKDILVAFSFTGKNILL